MDLEGTSSSPQMEIFGRLGELAVAAGRVVSKLPGLDGLSPVVDLLATLLQVQESQITLLKSIKADTTALRSAPFKEALHSLEDARLVGPRHPYWNTYIHRAEDKMSEAYELASGPRERAVIEYNRGVIHLTLGFQDIADRHLRRGQEFATQVVDQYGRKAKDYVSDERPNPAWQKRKWALTTLNATAYTVLFGTAGFAAPLIGGYAAVRESRKQSLCDDLNAFPPFHNLIEDTASRVSGEGKPQYLALSPVRDVKYPYRGPGIGGSGIEPYSDRSNSYRLVVLPL